MFLNIVTLSFKVNIAYRFDFITGIISEIVRAVARIAIWAAVYETNILISSAAPNFSQITTHLIISGTLVTRWEFQGLIRNIDQSVKSGDLSIYLLHPIDYPIYLFAREVGNYIYSVAIVALPAVLILSFWFDLDWPDNFSYGLLFIAFWFVGFTIFFLIACLFGLLTIWLMTAFAIEWLLEALMPILAGILVPLWLLPEPFATLAGILPFAWIGYYPSQIYLGRIELGVAWILLVGGVLWVGLLVCWISFLWHRATKQFTVHGG